MARGRKVNSNGERSKQLLLEMAIDLFSKHGYHETKISDIVKAANLTQPTFYLYFKSKDTLFWDLNEEFKQKLLSIFTENVDKLNQNESTVLEFIHNSISGALTYFYENPKLTKIGFYEAPNAVEIKDQLAQCITAAFSHDNGTLVNQKGFHSELLAHSLIGSIERLTLKYILTQERAPEQLAEEIIQIYFRESVKLVTA